MILSPVELRHKLHKNPELSFEEHETTKLLINSVENLNNDNITVHTPFKTGLLVEYKVNNGSYLLFRADIDALPVKEENDIEFRSTNNYMHACGHDVHTSILYSFIQHVITAKIDRNILFLFQPAEESGGGAMQFYDTGIFDRFNITNAFALHLTDEYPENTIASTEGVLFASALEIDIEYFGVPAHIAFPYEGKSALSALRLFLDSADSIPKNYSEPFVFAAGKIISGEVRNIIPAYAKLEGTIRSLSSKKALEFTDKLNLILESVKNITGVNYSLIKGAHYPEVIVDNQLFNSLKNVLEKKYNFIDCGYKMTGEDFGFFSQKYPSFMFWLGTSRGERFGLHNPRFLPPDEIIETGKNIFTDILNNIK
jgi:N-acetyldiaminopimelate deacetylase